MRIFKLALIVAIWAAAQCCTFAQVIIQPWPPVVPGTVWKAELGTSGDWFDESLWTEGVPDEETAAFLVNGSETLFTGGLAAAKKLRLSTPVFGQSLFSQTGGELTVSQSIDIYNGIYRMGGGRLSAKILEIGPLFQLEGLPDLDGVPGPEYFCNNNSTCAVDENLLKTEAIFLLEGGEVQFESEIRVGWGELEIIGGKLQAANMLLDGFSFSNNDSQVNQRGGLVTFDGDLNVLDGTYALAGGELAVGRLVMGYPTVNTTSFLARASEFLQTGGELHVLQSLELYDPGLTLIPRGPGFIDRIRAPRFADMTYRLQAGQVTVDGDTVVGSSGIATARFLQSGGIHHTAGRLRVYGVESRYELSGGELQVGTLAIGIDVFNKGGTFAISAGAKLVVQSRMTLGALAVVEATSDAQIQLVGGDVEILGSDASLLAGLENVSLFVTGGIESSTLEAASLDLGNGSQNFNGNFAWDELIVGSETEVGQLRLADVTDNHVGVEAVYVDHLVVTAGSTLDLNGLNLYYRTAEIAGQIVTTAGGALFSVAVPEPATTSLLLLAMIVVCGGRKKSM